MCSLHPAQRSWAAMISLFFCALLLLVQPGTCQRVSNFTVAARQVAGPELNATSVESNPCGGPAFEYNEENWKDSDAAGYFYRWSKEAVKTVEFRRYGEVQLFAREHWGGEKFSCTYAEPPCTPVPTCEAVWSKLSKSKREGKELVEDTRRAWLLAQAFTHVARYGNVRIKMLHYLAYDVTTQFLVIIEYHSKRPNTTKGKQCSMFDQTMKVLHPMYVKVMSAAAGMQESGKAFIADLEASATNTVIGIMTESKYNKKNEMRTWTLPPTTITPRYNECAREHATSTLRWAKFSWFLSSQFMLDQNSWSYMMDVINDGTLNHEHQMHLQLTTMAGYLNSAFWPDMSAVNYGVEREWKDDLMRAFGHPLTSAAWAASHCYIKCKKQAQAGDFCKGSSRISKFRFCSTEDSVACQAQCWGQDTLDMAEQPLYGMNRLGHYNVKGVEEVMRNSWDSYKKHGGNYGMFDNFVSDPLDFVEENLISLPVCLSDDNVFDDFTKDLVKGRKDLLREPIRADNKLMFPWTCGDWRGSESHRFFQLIGYSGPDKVAHFEGLTVKQKDPSGTRWTFQNVLPWAMRKTSPIKRYLTFCEHNVHWPEASELYKPKLFHKYPPGMHLDATTADRRCASIQADTRDMDEKEANDFFCGARSAAIRELFADETMVPEFKPKGTKGLGALVHHSHAELCRKYIDAKILRTP
ncbi:hypothetical protein PVAG01_04483 [Phlyctema vagabunda]|uniref:Uncharacterized protein n=1 Tax=Phlyctema vagabunda TaxID=108571 RepID=A0ABR4PPB6_9HELO